jgi:hypothetical protein
MDLQQDFSGFSEFLTQGIVQFKNFIFNFLDFLFNFLLTLTKSEKCVKIKSKIK